jgi:hypothetical protein
MIQKLNKDHKPLEMAVFLAIAGLLVGFLSLPKAGTVQKVGVSGGTSLIPHAQGAEIDSAALTVQDAPFLVSPSTADEASGSVPNISAWYSNGALKDPGTL